MNCTPGESPSAAHNRWPDNLCTNSKHLHDVMSGARDDRPGFAECMQYLREGDTLIVWQLDRLGRNMRGIINTLHQLTERGVTVRSLHDGVDTSTSTGRMVAGILMAIAEYERELVRERTALKLEHARKSGRKFGRPAKLNADQAALARRMKANGETAATICRTLEVGRTTLYRYLAESGEIDRPSPGTRASGAGRVS
jgi:DNA invertase Pin-like site-specific DNA recombinase